MCILKMSAKDASSSNATDNLGKYPVVNLDEAFGIHRELKREPLQPQTWTYRTICVGPTGIGKTNAIINGIINGFWPWNRIYVFAKTLDQPAFVFLKGWVKQREQEILSKTKKKVQLYFESSNVNDIHELEGKVNKKILNLAIVDDFITDKQWLHATETLAIRGRHSSIAMIMLSQSFFDLPKVLRLQIDVAMLFGSPSAREISAISSSLATDLTTTQFKQIYKFALSPNPDEPGIRPFFYIDNTNEPSLKYRQFYDVVLNIVLIDEPDTDSSDEETNRGKGIGEDQSDDGNE